MSVKSETIDRAAAAVGGKNTSTHLVIALAAAAGEALLAAGLLMSALPLSALAVGHAAIIGVLAWHALDLAKRKEDATRAALICLATAATGPVGALASAVALFAFPKTSRPEVLQAWYDTLALASEADPERRITDRILTGRVSAATAAAPNAFKDVIARGDLGRQQAVLGIIARKFHPDYAPALAAALKSPEPVVRVQAAAVAVHVSKRFDTGIDQLMHWAHPENPVRFETQAIARERELLAAGAFKDFRNARRERNIRALGLFRVRSRNGARLQHARS